MFAGLRNRLQHISSHNSDDNHPRISSKGNTPRFVQPHHVSFIASPLDPKTTEWLKDKHSHSNLTLRRRPTVAQQEANRVSGGIFRKQHEASPLELFVDLFFVANLAVFTNNHPQVTGSALADYVGFFCLLWTFWFHIAIHDVRFHVDSLLNRFFKLSQLIMFTTLPALARVYGVLEDGGTTLTFNGLAIVFMISRYMHFIQYGVVLWFVRPFKKTVVPCALMMVIYLCSGCAFLGSYLFKRNQEFTGTDRDVNDLRVWYAVICIEAISVIVVSSVWRILSFKHTHLVERVGLLTLIVMGEGVIGLTKSIAYVLDGTNYPVLDAAGKVTAGVFLIYLIFVVYFKPIANDHFGTIRQQIWVLLHLPLHVAIVLSGEGSSAALLWTSILSAREDLVAALPDYYQPSRNISTLVSFITKVNSTMTDTANTYTYYKLKDKYNWTTDLSRFQNISSPYASAQWNEQATQVLSDMINKTSIFFFDNFHFETSKETMAIKDPNAKLLAYYDSMAIFFAFFYISSGCILLVLAAMYWIGRRQKPWEEWVSIATRLLIGVALPLVSIAAYTQPYNSGFMFSQAEWLVALVLFCYLFIVIVDNMVQNIYDKRICKQAARGELEGNLEDLQKRRNHNVFGPQASNDSSSNLPSPHTVVVEGKVDRRAIHFDEEERGHRDGEQRRYLSPGGRSNNGYGRIDTDVRKDEDVERDGGFMNDRSFEEERMMSPVSAHEDAHGRGFGQAR